MRLLITAGLGLILLAGCGGGPSDRTTQATHPATQSASQTPTGPATFTVRGHIDVNPSGFSGHKGRPCTSDNGYDDIAAGANVVVYDPQDEKVAIGSLGPGHYLNTYVCRFSFAVTDVPDTFPLYSVEVSHRGELTYKRADLNRPLGLVLT